MAHISFQRKVTEKSEMKSRLLYKSEKEESKVKL